MVFQARTMATGLVKFSLNMTNTWSLPHIDFRWENPWMESNTWCNKLPPDLFIKNLAQEQQQCMEKNNLLDIASIRVKRVNSK